MKKIFTFIAAMLLVSTGANAKYQLDLENLTNGWGSTYDAATKTISYEEQAWGGRGWGFEALDFAGAEVDGFLVILKSATVKPKLVVEYTDGTQDADGNYTKLDASTAKEFGTSDRLLWVPFDESKEKLLQVYIQNTSWEASVGESGGNPAGEIVLVDAFLATLEEYEELKAAAEAANVAAWEGTNDFGHDWASDLAVVVSAEKFAGAGAGTVVEFEYTLGDYANEWGTYSQLKLCVNTEGWPAITSNKSDTNEWDCATATGTSYKVILNAEDAVQLAASGLVITGYNLTVTKVIVNNADAVNGIVAPSIAVETAGAIYNLRGQKVDANYKGLVIKDGKKLYQK